MGVLRSFRLINEKKIRIVKDIGFTFIAEFFKNGHPRSIEAKKNIIASFAIKGGSILISLLLVPLTIGYVNPAQYGIWLTLSSIVAWFSFFDIGFSNGFRNKFTIARSEGNDILARHYVSTIYTALGLIFIVIWCLFFFANFWLDWTRILNIDKSYQSEVWYVAIIVFTYFCIQFVLKIIGAILTADQNPSKASLLDTLSQVFSLLIIYIMVHFTKGSLLNLSIGLSAAPIIVLSIANVWFFSGEYKQFRPSLKLANSKYAKDILNLGLKFFVIQIAGLIQYQTANFLIAHFFGSYEVTSYNIAYKYFFILNMVFTILLVPFWSGVTDAYASNDFAWIENARNKYLKIFYFFIFLGVIMLVFAPLVFDFWIGIGVVNIPFSVSLWCFIYACVTMFSTIHVSILNGIGALKIQFYLCMVSPILYVLISYFLIKHFSLGISGIIIASVLANVNGIIVAPFQYWKIRQGMKGIWVK